MPDRTGLLIDFRDSVEAEGGFILPPPAVEGQPTAVDGLTRIVEDIRSVGLQHRVQRHIVLWWDGDRHVKRNAEFYVVDPGMGTEEAHWLKRQDPKPPPGEPTFETQVRAWLSGKVGQVVGPYTIKHIGPISPNSQTSTATAWILVDDGATLEWIQIYLWKDAAGIHWQQVDAGSAPTVPG